MINVTDLNEYLFCQRKLYLKIKGIKSPPTMPMIKGMLKHKIIEAFSKGEENLISGIISQLNDEEILELYRKNCFMLCQNIFSNYSNMVKGFRIEFDNFWKDFWDSLEPEIALRTKVISQLISKRIFSQQLWQQIEPKYKIELKMKSEKLGIEGRVDRVEIGKDEITPYEIKNKKASDFYESDAIQLTAYSMLLEDNFFTSVKKGIIQYKDKRLILNIDEQLREKVRMLISKIMLMGNEPCPPISENFKKCQSCGMKEECFKFTG